MSDANEMGSARRIDALGRVVVPAELRRLLGIRQGDLVAMRVEDGRLVGWKIAPGCALCGRSDDLVEVNDKHLCARCVDAVSLV
jgi:AbrB family transcriptional regulator, transcriptional pleiotropic regulator of transition state genes